MVEMTEPRQVIVGIDPGSRIAGYAFIRAKVANPRLPRDFQVIDAGVMRAPAQLETAERIGLLHEALYGLLAEHKPQACVMETPFFDKNVHTAVKLGETRGAFIAACARVGVKTHEITPAEVKKTIAGNGRADKELISQALRALIGFDRGQLPHDVTDALAISLCYGLKLAERFATLPTRQTEARKPDART
jgi:crossover junction endodeoxyribonuclease RuvC